MNKRDMDVLLAIHTGGFASQRALANICGCSLGAINASLKVLQAEGCLDTNYCLTSKSLKLISENSPKRAVLLADGFEMWISPVSQESPRALFTVFGQTIIERLIGQLIEKGITEIYAVVGYAKEQFEFLIDKYGVNLIVNVDYATRGNLHSLALCRTLSNCYIVPCDIYCNENPFRECEMYSWYMISEEESEDSPIRANRKNELVSVHPAEKGNKMLGIGYLTAEDAATVKSKLEYMDRDRRYKGVFWEESLFLGDKLLVAPRTVSDKFLLEIPDYETLREITSPNEVSIPKIAAAMKVPAQDITNIKALKKGLNNRSYLFECRGQRYVLRIPYDTGGVVNRVEEAQVYSAIKGSGLCEEVVYINSENGLKISRYIDNVKQCDPNSKEDVEKCMAHLRRLHTRRLKVGHGFDIFSKIEQFEKMWGGEDSFYKDYKTTKENVFSLKEYLNSLNTEQCLCHIDSVFENFLLSEKGAHLIDWEYGAMQDPHIDIAMFGIYAQYNNEEMDRLIDLYFENTCPYNTRTKIYCYIAVCGLLWSNWCEYEYRRGAEFGEYSLKQYRYAKEYYKTVVQRLKKGDKNA